MTTSDAFLRQNRLSPRTGAAVLLVLIGMTAQAQLNETCTVSILNRTAQVDEDGSWVLPQVPSGMGRVRARATCFENGITRVGQSDFFTVPQNGMLSDIQIVFDTPQPAPASLVITAAHSTLTAIGETVQVQVAASFADGSVRTITSDSGITYSTTNPTIASVSSSGVVTANSSGIAIVSAMHDGALGLFRVAVTGVLDTDGDGMPDDFELANGLNPNNPNDAPQDLDSDGLTNVQEFGAGTNPRVADSDGDGLRDGLELQVGSDPLDPASTNLAQALTRIRITPAALFLVVNTIEGEASIQTRVIGDVIDGTTIDLTARSRGTTYEVASPTVANFGPVDGQVFAGANGTTTLTVRNSGFTVTAPISVASFAPIPLSTLNLTGYANNIDVLGNFAYVAAGAAGLHIIDVTNRSAPRVIATFNTPGNANDVRVVGTRALIADGGAGLVVVDISVPTQPQQVAIIDTPGDAVDLAVSGSIAYVADGAAGLQIIDTTSPGGPTTIGTAVLNGAVARGIDVDAGLAVVAASAGLRIIDVTSPTTPVILGSLATTDARDVRLEGRTAFVADFTGSLRVVDLSNPALPVVVATTDTSVGGILHDVELDGDLAFGADVFFTNGVPIIDVANPSLSFVRGRLDFPPPYRDDNGNGVAVDSSYVYLVASTTIQKPGVSGVSALYVGQYRAIEDRLGIPPAVTITTPAGDTSASEGVTLSVTVQATDDYAVRQVTLFVNGIPTPPDTLAPYTFAIPVPIDGSTLELRATALDLGGNLGESAARLVTITPDVTPPTVAITFPQNGQSFANGTSVNVSMSALDPAGIARVEFLVNGIVAQTVITAPYTFAYTLPNEPGPLTLTARAFDRANNAGISSAVAITIFRDDPPLVTFSVNTGPALFSGGQYILTGNVSDESSSSMHVDLFIDGEFVAGTNANPSFSFTRNAPHDVSSFTVAVRAEQSNGLMGWSSPQTIAVERTTALAALAVPGYAYDLAVQGDRAYIAAGIAGVHVVDIANPSNPILIQTFDTPGDARAVQVRGSYAYIADGPSGVHVTRVLPNGIEIVGSVQTTGAAYDVAYRPNRLYVGSAMGVEIVDISDPHVPRFVSRALIPLRVHSVDVRDGANGRVVLAMSENYKDSCTSCDLMTTVQVANELQPFASTQVPQILTAGSFSRVVVAGTRAYVASELRLHVLNVQGSPLYPSLGTSSPSGPLWYGDIAVADNIGFIANAEQNKSELRMTSVANPASMTQVGTIKFGSLGTYHGTSVVINPELAYTTGLNLYPANVTNPNTVQSKLFIGRYRARQDNQQVAPTVEITSPTNAESVRGGQALHVAVAAADDVAVKTVTLSVNGNVVATASVAPYDFVIDAPISGPFSLTATATDYAGLTTTSSAVMPSLAGDVVGPAVQLLAPGRGLTVIGQSMRLRASAVDDVAMATVKFLMNGVVIAEDSTSPFDVDLAVPFGAVSGTFSALARDSSGNETESSGVTVSFATAQPLGALSLSSRPLDVAVSGTLAYVITESGLVIVNLVDPAAPQVIGTLSMPCVGAEATLLGMYVYVACRRPPLFGVESQLLAIDVANPTAPQQVATATGAHHVAVTRTTVYTSGDVAARLHTFPNAFQAPSTIATGDVPMHIQDSRLLTGFAGTLRVYQGSTVAGSLATGDSSIPVAVRISGGLVAAGLGQGIIVSNVDDRFSWSARRGDTATTDIDLLGDTLAATSAANTFLYDIGTPKDPSLRATFNFAAFGGVTLRSVALTPTLVVAVGSVDQTFKLFTARHRAFDDSFGVMPVATLTTGFQARVGQLLDLRVTASDDVGVASVTFIVNGVDQFTDATAQYEFNYVVPSGVAELTIQARVVDYGGNTTMSDIRTLAVSP